MWSVVTGSLNSLDEQIREEKAQRTHGFFTNAFSSSKQEQEGAQMANIGACLSKVEGATHLHNHLTLYFVTRALKVFHTLCEHGVMANPSALEAFRRIEAMKNELGDAFSLLKDRIESVSTQLEL